MPLRTSLQSSSTTDPDSAARAVSVNMTDHLGDAKDHMVEAYVTLKPHPEHSSRAADLKKLGESRFPADVAAFSEVEQPDSEEQGFAKLKADAAYNKSRDELAKATVAFGNAKLNDDFHFVVGEGRKIFNKNEDHEDEFWSAIKRAQA